MRAFGDSVRRAAARGRPPGRAPRRGAGRAPGAARRRRRRGAHAAPGGGRRPAPGAAQSHRDLQGVPWEALCKPGEALGFWGSSADRRVVRGVTSTEGVGAARGARRGAGASDRAGRGKQPRGPEGSAGKRMAKGEVKWLDPIVGPGRPQPVALRSVGREPIPRSALRLRGPRRGRRGRCARAPARGRRRRRGDVAPGRAARRTQQIPEPSCRECRAGGARSCEGEVEPGSSRRPRTLARAGVDAVVAHLWPVKTDVARAFSSQLYRALTVPGRGRGDVAAAVNDGRRSCSGAFAASAEAFSPVLYLRGTSGSTSGGGRRRRSGALPAERGVLGRDDDDLAGCDLLQGGGAVGYAAAMTGRYRIPSYCGHQHHLGPRYLPIRQRIRPRERLQLRAFVIRQLDPIRALPRHQHPSTRGYDATHATARPGHQNT